MSFNISEHFERYFSLCLANTEELKAEAHRIRYEVYCEELNYEPPSNFPDGMEQDAYDSHSITCLLQHKATGIYAGCVRLVLPQSQKSQSFPWQKYDCQLIYPYSEHKQTKASEISRLAVRSQFRKRRGDSNIPLGAIAPDIAGGQRRFPIIAMSLSWAAICIALNLGLDAYAVMEPRLARHLKRCSLHYSLVSNLFEFNGTRGLFFTKPPELLERMDPITYKFIYSLNAAVAQGLAQGKHLEEPLLLPRPELVPKLFDKNYVAQTEKVIYASSTRNFLTPMSNKLAFRGKK